MENVTIKVLASRLNLSATTISKALKNSYEISEPTKQKVLQLAAELNYTPNVHAGSLRTKKSQTIAVVIPEVEDSFFAQAINGIESVAREKGYHVLVYLTHESVEREQAMLKEFKSGRVDGVLISVSSSTSNSDHIKPLQNEQIPVVFFDRACNDITAAKITTDDFNSSYRATEHLITNGATRPAILLPSRHLAISNERLSGYQQALKDRKIKTHTAHIQLFDESTDLFALAKKLLQQKHRPDAVICGVDKLTLPVYLACNNLGLHIPQDVKVISFSNNPSGIILNPSLSAIVQPAYEMGKVAATALFKSLLKKKHNLEQESEVLPSVLMERASSAKA